MSRSIHPFEAALGAEVRGIDLSTDINDAAFEQIKAAWNQYSVLLFRDQKISPADQVRFTRRFGELEIHWLNEWIHPDHPEILLVSNLIENGRHIGVYNAGHYWHSDLSYMEEPSRGSFLYAIEIPERNGKPLGDTLFTSTAVAYDALPEVMKKRIEDLSAVFSVANRNAKLSVAGDSGATQTEEQRGKTPETVHKVVRTHPVTGRKCIYVNEGHTSRIVGLPEEESRALITELCVHVTRPEFIYGHRWRVGDFLMWDNVPTQHVATFDYQLPQRRHLHRTTIKGDRPF
ncbi:MAG: TauD/TfdA dioxygenase family protein [Gammaproteobacteria bacterium]